MRSLHGECGMRFVFMLFEAGYPMRWLYRLHFQRLWWTACTLEGVLGCRFISVANELETYSREIFLEHVNSSSLELEIIYIEAILKPHWTVPSMWYSVIAEIYRFFSEPTISSFVFTAVPIIAAWGCGTVSHVLVPSRSWIKVALPWFQGQLEESYHRWYALSWLEGVSELGYFVHVSLKLSASIRYSGGILGLLG